MRMKKRFYSFGHSLLLQKDLIWAMTRREIAAQYVGSFLGFVWTFVHPLVMIAVFWVVFSNNFNTNNHRINKGLNQPTTLTTENTMKKATYNKLRKSGIQYFNSLDLNTVIDKRLQRIARDSDIT